MPPPKAIAALASDELVRAEGGGVLAPDHLRVHFDDVFMRLLDIEYEKYLEIERGVCAPILADLLADNAHDVGEAAIARRYDDLLAFSMSIIQSRKSRAGKAFEAAFDRLFSQLGYPYQVQQKVDRNSVPDFIVPGIDVYQDQPGEAVVFTMKRTLRERWRQILMEGSRFPAYFLVTIDEKLSASMLGEAAANRIYVVAPQPIIDQHPLYAGAPNVISIATLMSDFVEPRRKRWPAKYQAAAT